MDDLSLPLDALSVDEVLPSSPGAGRSESPSQGSHSGEGQDQSRAAYSPASAASEPFTGAPRSYNAGPETVMEAGQSSGGPVAGREDEPEHPRPRRRNLVLQLPAELYDQLQRMVERSGLPRAHFLTTSIVIGAKRLAEDVRLGG